MKEKIKSMSKLWIQNDSTPVDNFDAREIAKEISGNVILIGMRRLGKTEYLKYRYNKMLSVETPDITNSSEIDISLEESKMDTLFINFDDPIFSSTDFGEKTSKSFQQISDSIEVIISEENIRLVLIDEIQRRFEWTRWLKGLIDKYKKITFVCTGSDAKEMLSSSEFGGTRFKIFYMGQYTYAEYKRGANNVLEPNFIDYVDNNFYPSRKLSQDYNGQFMQIIEKQMLTRKIKRTLISAVLKYIALNPGLKLNSNKIASAVSENDSINVDTRQITTVIDFLLESQLIFRIKNIHNDKRIKKQEYRYFSSNFNVHRFYTTHKSYKDLIEGIPRKGLVFENIIISNVHSSLSTDLERESIGYFDNNGLDVDFVFKDKNVEIKSFDLLHSSKAKLFKSAIKKMNNFQNPIIVHTGDTKTINGIELINYESFLEEELWKT